MTPTTDPDDLTHHRVQAMNDLLVAKERLVAENERLRKLETLVHDILSQTNDDHCHLDWGHLYPELATLVGMEWKPRVLDVETMLNNCRHFVACLMSGEHYVTPSVTEEEAGRLRALNARLAEACEAGLRYHEAIEAMNPSPFVPESEAIWERNAALYHEWHDKAEAALAEAREAEAQRLHQELCKDIAAGDEWGIGQGVHR